MPVPKNSGGRRPDYKRPRGEVKNQRDKLLDRDPPYPVHLSKVFPLRWVGSMEDASNIIHVLLGVGRCGFALTTHKAAIDGRVYLWLSWDNAEFLVTYGYLKTPQVEKTVK